MFLSETRSGIWRWTQQSHHWLPERSSRSASSLLTHSHVWPSWDWPVAPSPNRSLERLEVHFWTKVDFDLQGGQVLNNCQEPGVWPSGAHLVTHAAGLRGPTEPSARTNAGIQRRPSLRLWTSVSVGGCRYRASQQGFQTSADPKNSSWPIAG